MIAIGSDHAGYALKEEIKLYLEEKGVKYKDFGTGSEQSVHYPVYAGKVAEAIQSSECDKGILVCGTGIGISIAANKFKGIRCAACSDTFSARMTRLHNDANIIAIGARVVGGGLAMDIIEAFLTTGFEGGKHAVRVDMITELENRD